MKFWVLSVGLIFCIAASSYGQDARSVSYQMIDWSPDGKNLSFTRMDITMSKPMVVTSDIYTMLADGTGLRRVTGDGSDEFGSAWSRNGKSLFVGVTFEGGKSGDIYTVGADGTNLKRLTVNHPHAAAPSVSSDGKWVLFNASPTEHKPQIYIMKSDGTGARPLTSDNTVAFYNPVWSPDGKHIVYYVERGDQKDQIWSMDRDGSNQKLLTNNIGHNFYPSWTADGKRILFTSNRDGKQQLYTMKTDGTDIKPLGVDSFYGRLSPDGKKLAYIGGRFPAMTLWIAGADGSNPVQQLK